MKISAFPALLSFIVAAALGYLAENISFANGDSGHIVVGVGTGLTLFATLVCLMAVKLENERVSVNMKTWSTIALIVIAIINFCFAVFGVAQPYYIIILTLFLVLHLWMVWKMKEVKDI